jgi:hypothetical protein
MKMFMPFVYSLAFLSLISAGPPLRQQPAHPEQGPAESKDLIRRAGLSMSEYKARFKDLTAQEEQKVEEYDSQGK